MSEEILIVDDNADIRNIINELIIDAGYKTRLAANYNQALAEIDKKLPDVAILDVKLDKGDNDGIELLSHIKSKNKDTPVIIISGHANIEMAVKSLQHGAFEFIEKPFDQERLLNFVKRAVENFNLKKQNREYESKLFSSYELIGNSKNIVNIIDQIKKISVTESRVFISGPSGSGKTTLLNLVGLIDTSDEGTISFNGKDLTNLNSEQKNKFRRNNYGFIYQNYNLLENFNAIENVALPLILNGYSKDEAKQRAENIMKVFMIDDRSFHFPNSLSGGEQQRVAISRALVNNPKFIIADEPTGNLDSKNSDLVFNYLKNYVESENMTLIIATHDDELASKADKRINL